jgi:hypothetical protein
MEDWEHPPLVDAAEKIMDVELYEPSRTHVILGASDNRASWTVRPATPMEIAGSQNVVKDPALYIHEHRLWAGYWSRPSATLGPVDIQIGIEASTDHLAQVARWRSA